MFPMQIATKSFFKDKFMQIISFYFLLHTLQLCTFFGVSYFSRISISIDYFEKNSATLFDAFFNLRFKDKKKIKYNFIVILGEN